MTVKGTDAASLGKVAGLDPAMFQEASSLALLEGGLLAPAEPPEDCELLSLISHALEAMVASNEQKEQAHIEALGGPDMAPPPVLTVFHGMRAPPITLEAYLLRIAKYAHCSPACFAAAFMYVSRLVDSSTALAPTSLNVHRLLLTGVLLAAKFLDDRYYNNAFYARVGGISTLELNRLELEMLKLLDFKLGIPPSAMGALLGALQSGSLVLEAYASAAGAMGNPAAPGAVGGVVGGAYSAPLAVGEGRGWSFGRKRRSIGDPAEEARRLARRSTDAVAAAVAAVAVNDVAAA